MKKVKFNKTNLLAFMDGLDYAEPNDNYQDGWHRAIELIREHINTEMK